jgi:DNA-binding protein
MSTEQVSEEVVFVGKKAPILYAYSVIALLNEGKRAVLKARGRSIVTAVDASQIALLIRSGTKIESVQVGTELLPANSERQRRVSFISIHLT